MLDRVTIRKFSELSGYTEVAVRSKIKEGIWRENQVFSRAPDNRILISLSGYEAWVDRKRSKVSGPRLKVRSKSSSHTPMPPHGNGRDYLSSPPPLI